MKRNCGHCYGEKNGRAKLKYFEVLNIRGVQGRQFSQRVLARMYGVGKTTIQNILAGIGWNNS